MPCTKCEEGKYKWGETGECKYDTLESCESANSKYNKMQPTPLGKKTYEQYAKELKEFNLSKVEKIELGLMDEMKKLKNKGNSLMPKAKEKKAEYLKIVNEYNQKLRDLQDFTKIDRTINSLGETESALYDLRLKIKDLASDEKDLEVEEKFLDDKLTKERKEYADLEKQEAKLKKERNEQSEKNSNLYREIDTIGEDLYSKIKELEAASKSLGIPMGSEITEYKKAATEFLNVL